MSTQIVITNPSVVKVDKIHDTRYLTVLYETDDWGNNYISIPLSIVKATIEKHEEGK